MILKQQQLAKDSLQNVAGTCLALEGFAAVGWSLLVTA